jgi:hypothetical protein
MGLAFDTTQDCSTLAPQLLAKGYDVIIRYYSQNAWKRLGAAEALAISRAGLRLAVVYQDRQNQAEDFSAYKGRSSASAALDYAHHVIFQPAGSAIYFSVDYDATSDDLTNCILPFFAAVRAEFDSSGKDYQIGVYGSGLTCRTLQDAGVVDFTWLAQSTGFLDYNSYLSSQKWALAQRAPTNELNIDGDPDEICHQGKGVFGGFMLFGDHFGPAAQAPTSMVSTSKVNAASGLWLRAGPGMNYATLQVLPAGKEVGVLGRSGDWAQVALNGGTQAAGYVFGAYLVPAA